MRRKINLAMTYSHSMDVMQKCNEAYLQDSPTFYTEKYHTWKVIRTTVYMQSSLGSNMLLLLLLVYA